MATKDKRLTFTNQVFIGSDGLPRRFDGKADLEKGVLKVYRVHGSVSQPSAIIAGLVSFAHSVGLSGEPTSIDGFLSRMHDLPKEPTNA
jgi:hypothetical protein